MPITLLPSLLLAIILVGFMPGPANLFSLHCSMKNGTKKAMTMWFGLLTGFTIAATLGAVVTHLVGAIRLRQERHAENHHHLRQHLHGRCPQQRNAGMGTERRLR